MWQAEGWPQSFPLISIRHSATSPPSAAWQRSLGSQPAALKNPKNNQLSMWSDLETPLTYFGCSVWFGFVILCRYYPLFIHDCWRWLGNSVQSLKIDSRCPSAEFVSAFWVAELLHAVRRNVSAWQIKRAGHWYLLHINKRVKFWNIDILLWLWGCVISKVHACALFSLISVMLLVFLSCF